MKRAIGLRATADRRARAAARLLAAALADATRAAAVMNGMNYLYDVDVSTQTLFVHTLLGEVDAQVLQAALAESEPGEEVVLFNQVPDGNGGQPLPASSVFGELKAAREGALHLQVIRAADPAQAGLPAAKKTRARPAATRAEPSS